MKKILLFLGLLYFATPELLRTDNSLAEEQEELSTTRAIYSITQQGFYDFIHKTLLAGYTIKGGMMFMHAPEKIKPYFAGALLYGLWIGYYSKMKIFKSEKYFNSEKYFDKDFGDMLERHINSVRPLSNQSEIALWMNDIKNHRDLLEKIGKKNFSSERLKSMRAELTRDIEHLFDWYVPCSNFMSWLRRTFNGGQKNYAMQHIDDFSTKEVEGANWGLFNLFDIRYGSSGYKIKMMKMVLLQKLLDHLNE